VVVVAEGAGQRLIEGESAGVDASGNVLKKDIGEFLKRHITNHFKAKGIISSVKYFDPSYMIRSVAARGTDAIRCYMLARSAVHAAMAGRTNCVVGQTSEWNTLVPISLATIERQKVNPKSDLWRSVMDATGQEFYFSGPSARSVGATLAP
jgi:6-phosphofructokinase 1